MQTIANIIGEASDRIVGTLGNLSTLLPPWLTRESDARDVSAYLVLTAVLFLATAAYARVMSRRLTD